MRTYKSLSIVHQRYLSFYLFTLPFALIGIFQPALEVPYALLFFAATVNLFFVHEKVPEFPQHSTKTHFQRASRFNKYNYIPVALTVLASLAFVFIPVNKALLILVFWTVSSLLIWKLKPQQDIKLVQDLIADYLHQQMPELEKSEIYKFVEYAHTAAELNSEDVMRIMEVEQDVAEDLLKLYLTYLRNN